MNEDRWKQIDALDLSLAKLEDIDRRWQENAKIYPVILRSGKYSVQTANGYRTLAVQGGKEFVLHRLYQGKRVGVVLVLRDLTGQQEAELSLKHIKEKTTDYREFLYALMGGDEISIFGTDRHTTEEYESMNQSTENWGVFA